MKKHLLFTALISIVTANSFAAERSEKSKIINGMYRVEATDLVLLKDFQWHQVTAYCDAGDIFLSGGCDAQALGVNLQGSVPLLDQSQRLIGNHCTFITGKISEGPKQDFTAPYLKSYAICKVKKK